MHVTDWFTTILHAAGLTEPHDRVIDGVDQLGWLTGQAATSAHEGYIYWMGPQMYGVEWRNFKLILVAQKYTQDAADKLPTPASSTWPPTRKSGRRSACPTYTPGPQPTSTRSSATSRPACTANRSSPWAHRSATYR